MHRIVEVSSNVKSGRVWTLNLTRKNLLLVGEPEEGKSAVLDAIWLALAGVPVEALMRRPEYKEGDDADAPGRWVMSSAYLDGLTSDAGGLYARVTFEDGSSAQYPRGSAARPSWLDVEPFPAHAAMAMFSGSEAKAAEWILSGIEVDVSAAQLLDGFSASDRAAVLDAMVSTDLLTAGERLVGGRAAEPDLSTLTTSPLAALDLVLDYAKKQKAQAQTDRRFNERRKTEFTGVREVSEAEVEAAASRPVPGAPDQTARIRDLVATVARLTKSLADMTPELQTVKAEWQKPAPEPPADLGYVTDLLRIMPEEGDCAFGFECPHSAKFRARRREFEKAFSRLTAEADEYRAAVARRNDLVKKLERLSADWRNLDNLRSTAYVELRTRGVPDAAKWVDPGAKPTVHAGPYKEDLVAMRTRWLEAQACNDKVKQAKLDEVRWKSLEDACAERKRSLAEKPIEALEVAASQWMPEGRGVKILRSLGNRGTFYPAIVKDGVVYQHTSGQQRNDVAMALGCVVSENWPFAVITQPEDHADSPDHLRRVMQALGGFKHPVILTSTCVMSGKAPAGWQVENVKGLR